MTQNQSKQYAYKVGDYSKELITKYEAVKITDKTIVYVFDRWDGGRDTRTERLKSGGTHWFRTYPEAVSFVRERANKQIKAANSKIDAAVATLEKYRDEA